jgi:hypothetical protein
MPHQRNTNGEVDRGKVIHVNNLPQNVPDRTQGPKGDARDIATGLMHRYRISAVQGRRRATKWCVSALRGANTRARRDTLQAAQ